MKRIAVILVALLTLAVIAGVAALPMLVSSENVRSRIIQQAETLTGQQMTFAGKPQVSFNPFLGIEMRDVNLGNRDAPSQEKPLLHAEIMRARLDIWSAIFGKVKIAEIQLVRPEFFLLKQGDGTANWVFTEGKIAEVFKPVSQLPDGDGAADDANDEVVRQTRPDVKIGKIEIKDAIVSYEDRISGTLEELTNLDAMIIWPVTSAPIDLSGKLIWRGKTMNFTTRVNDLPALASGGESPVRVSAAADSFSGQFTGLMNTYSDLYMNGELRFDTPSLSRLGQLTGSDFSVPLLPQSLSVRGQIDGTMRELTLSECTVMIDDNSASGLLQLRQDEVARLNISGTLAFSNLSVGKQIAMLLNSSTISFADSPVIDMRVSAVNLDAGELQLQDVAAALVVRDDKLEIDISDASLMDGSLISKMVLKTGEDALSLSVNAALNEFEVGAMAELFPERTIGLSGIANSRISLTSGNLTGKTWLRNLDGTIELNMADGTLTGIDLATITAGFMASPQADATSNANDFLELSGQTLFTALSAKMDITRGVAWLNNVSINANEQTLYLNGKTDLYIGGTALQARLVGLPGNNDPSVINRFFVGGTLASPVMTREPFWQNRATQGVPQAARPEATRDSNDNDADATGVN